MKVLFKERLDDKRILILDFEKIKTSGQTSTISYSDGWILLRGEKAYDLQNSEIEISTAEFDRIFYWAVKFDLIVK